MNPFKRLIPSALILLVVIVAGTFGYYLIEGWSLLDALYMVIITLFTIGFQEVHPLSDYWQVFYHSYCCVRCWGRGLCWNAINRNHC